MRWAAEAGQVDALAYYGMFDLVDGIDTKDKSMMKKGLKSLEKAFEMGSIEASYLLTVLYDSGVENPNTGKYFITPNSEKALKYADMGLDLDIPS